MGKAMRARRAVREFDALTFQMAGPDGLVVVRAFQSGADRWQFYFVRRGGRLVRVPVGPMLDAAQARLDEMTAAEQKRWADHARLMELIGAAKTWRRFVWLAEVTDALPGCRPLFRSLPKIGGRLWLMEKPKAVPTGRADLPEVQP